MCHIFMNKLGAYFGDIRTPISVVSGQYNLVGIL